MALIVYHDTFDLACDLINGSTGGTWSYGTDATGGRCISSGGSNSNRTRTFGEGVIAAGHQVRFQGRYATNVGGASRALTACWMNAAVGVISQPTIVNSGTNVAGLDFDITLEAPAGAVGVRVNSQSQASVSELKITDMTAGGPPAQAVIL